MELEPLAGPHWAGWTIGNGLIYAPGWRKGLDPGEILALPYVYAQVAEHRKQAQAARLAVQEMEALFFRAEHQARHYRAQLVLESRFGLMLGRVTE